MANHGGSGGAPGGNPGKSADGGHGDSAVKHNDAGDKPKGAQIEMQPITGHEFSQAGQTRTNVSDGSLRKYSQAHLDQLGESIEIVGHDRVVSRTKPGTEKDLLGSSSPNAHIADKTGAIADKLGAPAHHVDKSRVDSEVEKALRELAHQSPELKKLTENALAHISNPDYLRSFSHSLERFQHSKDLHQEEKDGTYFYLNQLLEAKTSKLEPFEKRDARPGTWTAERDAAANKKLRTALATDLMYHAAHPSRVNQGNFNTCNVTTQAERLFTNHPSTAAKIAVETALQGHWVFPGDANKYTIHIDPQSLRPAEGASTTKIPTKSGPRTLDVQILNVAMVNYATQQYSPPQIYVQQDPDFSYNPATKSFNQDSGERQYIWDPVAQKKLDMVKKDVYSDSGITKKPLDSPALYNGEIALIGHDLTGDTHYFLTPEKADRDAANKPIDDGLVHVESVEQMRQALRDLKANHHLPAIVYVDAHSPVFDKKNDFPPNSAHVVCVRDYDDKTGKVHISNQWGKNYDVTTHVLFLYDACHRMSAPDTENGYRDKQVNFRKFGHIKQDKDA